MIEINGKEYSINLDIKWGTQKLMRFVEKHPEDEKSEKYVELIVQDILIPSPTKKEMFEFRKSDIEKIFNTFADEVDETDKELKKKRSH